MQALRALAALAVAAGLLALVPNTSTAANPDPLADASRVSDPPNIVVIMSDDQRANTLRTMPVVRQQIRALGTDYEGVIPTSTCCPSRSSLLSGNFSHTTGVYTNSEESHGGWVTFNGSGYESKTLATALHAKGYETGLVGKYLNQWNRAPDGSTPPGWDVFRAIDVPNQVQGGGRYYNYNLRGTEPLEYFGEAKKDYSTDVLADRAVEFVDDAPTHQPLFLMFTPYAPHKPFTPAPRDKNSWTPHNHYRNKAVNERNMSDKPSFLQGLPLIHHSYIDEAQTKSGESLRAVDKAVGRLITAMGPRMNNTLIIYMSDNGVQWGEHRETDKNKPYRWSTDVPLMMRWDGHIPSGSPQEWRPTST